MRSPYVRHRAPAFASSVIALLTVFVLFGSAGPSGPPGRAPRVQPQVRENAVRYGKARVIVELRLPSGPTIAEGRLRDRAAVVGQRQAIAAGRDRVLARMAQTGFRVVHRYESVPYMALEVSAAALAVLENSGDDVASVLDDAILRPSLAQSVPVIQADQVWASGYDGAGTVVAVLDSGVDASHPFLSGKVVEEACSRARSTASAHPLPERPCAADRRGSGRAVPVERVRARHARGWHRRRQRRRRRTAVFRRGQRRADHGHPGLFKVHPTRRRAAARPVHGVVSPRTSSRRSNGCMQSHRGTNIASVNLSLGGGTIHRAVRQLVVQARDRQPAGHRHRECHPSGRLRGLGQRHQLTCLRLVG